MTRFITDWGDLGIFLVVVLGNLGLPVPEETVLALAGYLVWSGRLQLVPVLLVGIGSAVAGDNLGYWLGRRYGRAPIERYARWLLTPARVAAAEGFIRRYGALAVGAARFVGGTRFLAGPLAGAVGLPFRRFVTGNVLESHSLEVRAIEDLKRLFPATSEQTITRLLLHIRDNTASFGVIALITSIWFGASFWGALDTAFCRIYHVECRRWVAQKRFSLVMLVVTLFLVAATVAVPTAQSILVGGARQLPFGLADVDAVIYALSLAFGLGVLFLVLSLIYWAVPNRLVPWRAVWPGASFGTVAMGAIGYVFPLYLGGSPLSEVRSIVTFVVILLIWFYALAFIMLVGALINAAWFEIHDTGRLTVDSSPD